MKSKDLKADCETFVGGLPGSLDEYEQRIAERRRLKANAALAKSALAEQPTCA